MTGLIASLVEARRHCSQKDDTVESLNHRGKMATEENVFRMA